MQVYNTDENIFDLKVYVTVNENDITFNVLGFGHGVGLSQVGANTLARRGKSYEDIIHYYYTNVEIININK